MADKSIDQRLADYWANADRRIQARIDRAFYRAVQQQAADVRRARRELRLDPQVIRRR